MNETTAPTDFSALRDEMVDQVLVYANLVRTKTGNNWLSQRVLEVLRVTPRHEFVPANLQNMAYADSPLPIGHGKTISQPFVVALMTSLLDLQPDDQVLEVGTGLGYHTAVVARLCGRVFSIEILEELARRAERNLQSLDITNVQLGIGDGSSGWPEYGPFDKILLSTAPEMIPVALLNQLKPGGRMVIPTGLVDNQQLVLVEKEDNGRLSTHEILAVEFSPMTYSDSSS